MKPAELRAIVGAMVAAPWIADPAAPGSGSTTVRSTACVCTEERPSFGFCPACHYVADWVPVNNAAGIVALRNHAEALLELAEAVARWRSSECETESSTTDDYLLALAGDECAGDTHVEACPVAVACHAMLAALTALEELPR